MHAISLVLLSNIMFIVRERDHLGDPGLDERIVVRCIFRK
jgi:hypothetical protein